MNVYELLKIIKRLQVKIVILLIGDMWGLEGMLLIFYF